MFCGCVDTAVPIHIPPSPENTQEKLEQPEGQRELHKREKLEGKLEELSQEILLKKKEINSLETRKRILQNKKLRNSYPEIVALNVKITWMKTDIEMLKKRAENDGIMKCQCDSVESEQLFDD